MNSIEFASARWDGEEFRPVLTHDQYVARSQAATQAALQHLKLQKRSVCQAVAGTIWQRRCVITGCATMVAAMLGCFVIYRAVCLLGRDCSARVAALESPLLLYACVNAATSSCHASIDQVANLQTDACCLSRAPASTLLCRAVRACRDHRHALLPDPWASQDWSPRESKCLR